MSGGANVAGVDDPGGRASAIGLDRVWMIYHTREAETAALAQMSLEVAPQEFVAVVGPSGCGKSTVLSLVAGLIKPTSGSVEVCGETVTGPSGHVGYMLQQDCLYEWRTILGNALLGLEVQRAVTRESVAIVRRMLNAYGLGEFENHYPCHLSGGMRQRAALVRTLATRPDVLLLDEPLSALDYQTRLEVSEDLYRIMRAEGLTVLMVTHDISEAIAMSDRVLVMSRRPGRIKSSHKINLTCERQTPIGRREAPEFRTYFNAIWKELTADGHAVGSAPAIART